MPCHFIFELWYRCICRLLVQLPLCQCFAYLGPIWTPINSFIIFKITAMLVVLDILLWSIDMSVEASSRLVYFLTVMTRLRIMILWGNFFQTCFDLLEILVTGGDWNRCSSFQWCCSWLYLVGIRILIIIIIWFSFMYCFHVSFKSVFFVYF